MRWNWPCDQNIDDSEDEDDTPRQTLDHPIVTRPLGLVHNINVAGARASLPSGDEDSEDEDAFQLDSRASSASNYKDDFSDFASRSPSPSDDNDIIDGTSVAAHGQIPFRSAPGCDYFSQVCDGERRRLVKI